MSRAGVIALLLLLLAGVGIVSVIAPSRGNWHSSTFVGPFHIKANDALGIRLGMSLAEYSKTHPSDFRDCSPPAPDNTVSCSIMTPRLLGSGGLRPRGKPSNSDEIMIGDTKIDSYFLMFYRQRLIQIRYELISGVFWDTLLTAMEEKFGTPNESGKTRTWSNSVSSMRFDPSANDYSAASLDLSLTKETDDWLKEYEQYRKAKARKEL